MQKLNVEEENYDLSGFENKEIEGNIILVFSLTQFNYLSIQFDTIQEQH